MLKTIIAVAILLASSSAFAQTDGTAHDPTGTTYEIRFLAQPGTEEVCIHRVSVVAGVATAIDANADGTISQADAIGCTSSLVADNVAVNVLALDVVPPLTLDAQVAGRAYRSSGAPSVLSNWHVLRSLIGAPTLLD